MTGPAISAIVVTWNSEDAVGRCLDALRESERRASGGLEVVVVDNASTDASVDWAREHGADMVLVNPVNAGYGVAAAQGLARASAPWALLLNPDVAVDDEFLAALTTAADAAPADVATLVPDLRYESDKAIVNCRGIEVDRAGIPAEVETGAVAMPLDTPREVFGGSSGACLLRIDALREVGSVEPAFFAYMEDADLAWQLRRAGYRALLVPDAVAYHEGSASLGPDSPLKAFLVARNRRLLFRLNGPHTVPARAWRSVVELGHAAVVTAFGGGAAPWLGRLDAARLRPYTGFVRRSRALSGPGLDVRLAPRESLLTAFRRKRAATRGMTREPGGDAAGEPGR